MWFQQLQARFLQYDSPFILSPLFRTNILTVEAALDINAALPYGKRTYKYAGRLTPVFNRPDIGIHKGQPERLYLGKSQIKFHNPLNYEFALELVIHLWTPQLDLTIWESDEELLFDTSTKLAFIQASLDRIEQNISVSSGQ